MENSNPRNSDVGMGVTLKFGTIVILIESLCANNNSPYWSIGVRYSLSASQMVNFSIAIAGLPTTTSLPNGSFWWALLDEAVGEPKMRITMFSKLGAII